MPLRRLAHLVCILSLASAIVSGPAMATGSLFDVQPAGDEVPTLASSDTGALARAIELMGDTSDPVIALRGAGALAGVDLERVDRLLGEHGPADRAPYGEKVEPSPSGAPPSYAGLADVSGRDAGAVHAFWTGSGAGLAAHPPLVEALEELLAAVTAAHALAASAVDDLEDEDRKAIRALAAAWETSRRDRDRAPLAAAWHLEKEHVAVIDRDANFAAALLLTAAGATFAERMTAAPWPDHLPWPAPPAPAPAAGTSATGCLTEGAGILMLCGPGDDVSQGDHMVLLDLGGSDAHASNAGASGLDVLWPGNNGLPLALAVDIEGDDDYHRAARAQGAGSSTPGVLLDLVGDDTYVVTEAIGFAQGAGNLGGVGFAFDLDGKDSWLHERAVEDDGDTSKAWDNIGFGILSGIGIAWDVAGDDRFYGGLMSQGVGDFQAFGLLVDGAGEDLHVAKRFAQGFGDGAGAGLLLDLLGDDEHVLQDRAGQGYGIGGFGGFVDVEGDDTYVAGSSRARGAAEDGPLWKPLNDIVGRISGKGLFIDTTGDDSYEDGQGCDGCLWGLGDGADL